MSVAVLVRESRWECPNCDFTDITREANVHSRFHNCRGLKGLSAPMIPAGTKAKVEAKVREDYEGVDAGCTQKDGEGAPIMAIVTTRDEGQDVAVLAPLATAMRT